MRVWLKKDAGKHGKAGAESVDMSAVEAADLCEHGIAISLREHDMEVRIEASEVQRKTSLENGIKAKIADAKARKAIAPLDTAIEAKAIEQLKDLNYSDTGYTVIVGMIEAAQPKTVGTGGSLGDRAISAATTGEVGTGRVELGDQVSLKDAARAYIEAREPMDKLVKSGDLKAVTACSAKAGAIMSQHLMKPLKEGGDFMLRDCFPVEAADYNDPNSQLGILATGMVLLRNLGFLKNKLNWLPYFTTDLRNEPATFGQPVWTRYLTPPGVLTFIPGVGFTSDATTITNAGAGSVQSGIQTQTSGTRTLSVPSTTDRSVTMDQFKGVAIGFPITTLAATARNLFQEQRGAQLYSLAETINLFVLQKIFGSTWTGLVNSYSLTSGFSLPQMVTIKNRMTLSKIPDMGRFALLHSTYNDALLSDTNLLTAKAILALLNKDASAFEQGDVPSLFGVKPLESQLSSFKTGVQTAPTITNAGAVDFATPGINQVGFAGNQSSMLFAARVPQDFSQVAAQLGIPLSWAVEVVTEPDSGLTVMIFKNVNTASWQIEATVCLMYGAAQGDPRIGIVLTP